MISFENSFGERKQVKIGLSWTVLFFGWFVPLFRKDFKWFGIMILSQIFIGLIFPELTVIVNIIMFIMYNRLYINDLFDKGYRPATMQGERYMNSKGIKTPF